MRDQRPLTGAERQRLHYQRQKLGRYIIPVEVDNTDIDDLIDEGFLDESEARDRNCIAKAIDEKNGFLHGCPG